MKDYFKKTLFLICILIVGSLIKKVNGQIPTNGLVAYYPFNGDYNDYSGNGYHLTNDGFTFTQDYALNNNSAAFTNNSITESKYLANTNVPNSNTPTFCIWIKNELNSPFKEKGQIFFSFAGAGAINVNEIGLLQVGLELNYANWVTLYDENGVKDDGNWHFLVGAYDLNTFKGYVDNALVGTYDISNAQIDYDATGIWFGQNWVGGLSARGSIDDFRLYNRALSEDEISTLYYAYKEPVVLGSNEKTYSLADHLTIYPNPTPSGIFEIQSPEKIESVTLTDNYGHAQTFLDSPISTLMKGILTAKIKTSQTVFVKKVLVLD